MMDASADRSVNDSAWLVALVSSTEAIPKSNSLIVNGRSARRLFATNTFSGFKSR
jgi:hypothetical protein